MGKGIEEISMINVYQNTSLPLITITLDKFNEPTESSTSYDVRLEESTEVIDNVAGVLITSRIQIYFSSDVTLSHQDRITINGQDHKILRIDEPKAFSMSFYKKVWLS